MSARALNWAWSQKPKTASQKLVLAALADRADDSGWCWPSTKWIAEKCKPMPRETVRRILRELQDQDMLMKIERMRRKDGTLGPWYVQLLMPPDDLTTGHERTVDEFEPPVMGARAEPSKSKNLSVVEANAPTTAHDIVSDFVDSAKKENIPLPRSVVGQMAGAVGRLVKEGHTEADIRLGIQRMLQRGLMQPSLLPSFVTEAALPTREPMRYGRGMTTEQILNMAREDR